MLPPLSFVSVDFETANSHRGSACSVGLTKVVSGVPVETASWLIHPHESINDFHPINIRIHGITPKMVKSSGISWNESLDRMTDFIENYPVIAHNSGFDRSVWNHTNEIHELTNPVPAFYCTLSLSRKMSAAGLLNGLDNQKLNTLARYFGIEQLKHHEAGEDSLVAAHVALKLMEVSRKTSVLQAWGQPTSSGRFSRRIPAAPPKIRRNNLPSVVPTALPPESIVGEVLTLTGGLGSMTREDCWKAIEEAGGIVAKSVTRKTTVLVIGAGPDESMPPLLGENSKEKKAVELIKADQNIAVIGEPDLLQLLRDSS